jgi:hypothetical protein
LAGAAQVHGEYGVARCELWHERKPHGARFRIPMQQDHGVAFARDQIVQPRAVDIGESALYRWRGFKRPRFFTKFHETVFRANNCKYLTGLG